MSVSADQESPRRRRLPARLRGREIGIRLALGAVRDDVQWMVPHEGLWMVGAAGMLVGIPATLVSTKTCRQRCVRDQAERSGELRRGGNFDGGRGTAGGMDSGASRCARGPDASAAVRIGWRVLTRAHFPKGVGDVTRLVGLALGLHVFGHGPAVNPREAAGAGVLVR